MPSMSHCNTWPPARDLHTDPSRRRPPHAVMVCPVFRGALVWVKHAERGWELPGGKVEPGEAPEAAAIREAWEEAGLRLGRLVWLAEYVYDLPARADRPAQTQVKWVYAAQVLDAGARPASATGETLEVRCFRPIPSPSDLHTWPDASPIMRDAVYPLVLSELRAQGWL